jgi:hypothetical protein
MAASATSATTLEILGVLADHVITGVVTPGATEANGECDRADPSNWGELDGTTWSCSNYLPLLFAPGDLRIAGGSGQGTLVVMGELHIEDGVRFQGVILAGSLNLGRATIRGAIRSFGGDTTRVGGQVAFSGCAVERALGAPAMARPFRSARWWLPVR